MRRLYEDSEGVKTVQLRNPKSSNPHSRSPADCVLKWSARFPSLSQEFPDASTTSNRPDRRSAHHSNDSHIRSYQNPRAGETRRALRPQRVEADAALAFA